MFNLWDYIVSGLMSILDALLMPFLHLIVGSVSNFTALIQLDAIHEAVRIYLPILFPIVSMIDISPVVLALFYALAFALAKKAVAIWFFILDLIPVAR